MIVRVGSGCMFAVAYVASAMVPEIPNLILTKVMFKKVRMLKGKTWLMYGNRSCSNKERSDNYSCKAT